MAITAAMVKELREMTGAGMMDCKKALTETDGDMEKAIDILREKGLAAAAKKKKAQKNSHSLHITNDSRRTKNCPAAVWHILLSLHLWRKKKYGDRAIDSSAVSPARHHAVSQTYREYRCKQAPSSLPYWRR